jgi:hypothetical protein
MTPSATRKAAARLWSAMTRRAVSLSEAVAVADPGGSGGPADEPLEELGVVVVVRRRRRRRPRSRPAAGVDRGLRGGVTRVPSALCSYCMKTRFQIST